MNTQIHSDLEDNQKAQFISHPSILMYWILSRILLLRSFLLFGSLLLSMFLRPDLS